MLENRNFYFRCDGNTEIGMGHLVRCSAIADMLSKKGRVHFILKNTQKCIVKDTLSEKYTIHYIKGNETKRINQLLVKTKKNVLTLDGYSFDGNYQKEIDRTNCKLVVVDDLVEFEYDTDVIINQSSVVREKHYRTVSKTRFCLGLDYTLLRQPFLKEAKKGITPKSENAVFVSFGGADSLNMTSTLIELVLKHLPKYQIHVLIGQVNLFSWKADYLQNKQLNFYSNLSAKEVSKLLKKCKLAIVPASSLSLEVCATRTPMITGITAENQKGLYKTLVNNKAAKGMGDWNNLNERTFIRELKSLLKSKTSCDIMRSNQSKLIDGFSGNRIMDVYKSLLK